jgi:hypothetical protein
MDWWCDMISKTTTSSSLEFFDKKHAKNRRFASICSVGMAQIL